MFRILGMGFVSTFTSFFWKAYPSHGTSHTSEMSHSNLTSLRYSLSVHNNADLFFHQVDTDVPSKSSIFRHLILFQIIPFS